MEQHWYIGGVAYLAYRTVYGQALAKQQTRKGMKNADVTLGTPIKLRDLTVYNLVVSFQVSQRRFLRRPEHIQARAEQAKACS
jgi:hypothetical protein